MKKNIYLFVRGKKTGPHDISDCRKLLASGDVSLYDIAELGGNKMLLQNILSEKPVNEGISFQQKTSELSASPQALDSDISAYQPTKAVTRLASKPPPPPLLRQGATFFCKHCGNQVISAAVICTSCGSPTGNGAVGVPMAEKLNPVGYPNRKSRVTYVLLAFFVGGIGVHNFYSGHIMSGLFKILLSFSGLFTFGITWLLTFIIVIIEMCAVTKDSNGVPFN